MVNLPNIASKSDSNITYTNTRCIARFFSYSNSYSVDTPQGGQFNYDNILKVKEYVEQDNIIQCSISKNKADASAIFELILKPTAISYWINDIKPGDWVIIYLDDELNIDLKDKTNNLGLKLVGTIDRIAYNKMILDDGTAVRTISINGKDFGKVFEKCEFFYNPFYPPELQNFFVLKEGIKVFGPPQNFIETYLDIFLGAGSPETGMLHQLHLPYPVADTFNIHTRSKGNKVSFNDILNREISNKIEGWAPYKEIGKQLTGSAWDLLQQSSNAMMNELFLDIRDISVPDKKIRIPSIVFRPIPMTNEELVKLTDKPIEVFEKYIINENLGFSDHERYNYLFFIATNIYLGELTWLEAFKGKIPAVDGISVIKYGLNRYERTTDYGCAETQNEKEIKTDYSLITKWSDRLYKYWFNYWKYETGTLELKGLTNFKVGEMIKLPERNRLYMVESYQYQWKWGEPVTTTLELTHGIYADGNFIYGELIRDNDLPGSIKINSNTLPEK